MRFALRSTGCSWRDNGVELVTRIAGLLLAAIAVQLVANSAISFAHSALATGPDRWGFVW